MRGGGRTGCVVVVGVVVGPGLVGVEGASIVLTTNVGGVDTATSAGVFTMDLFCSASTADESRRYGPDQVSA